MTGVTLLAALSHKHIFKNYNYIIINYARLVICARARIWAWPLMGYCARNYFFILEKKIHIKNFVLDYIRYKQLNWYGHVQRMDQERLPRRLLEWVDREGWTKKINLL